jgi:hypothetical protein
MFAVPMQAWQRREFGERDERIDAHPLPREATWRKAPVQTTCG